MNDYIIRAIAANDQIRAFAAVTTETVETARQDHNTSPVATAALGRLLTAGATERALCWTGCASDQRNRRRSYLLFCYK